MCTKPHIPKPPPPAPPPPTPAQRASAAPDTRRKKGSAKGTAGTLLTSKGQNIGSAGKTLVNQ